MRATTTVTIAGVLVVAAALLFSTWRERPAVSVDAQPVPAPAASRPVEADIPAAAATRSARTVAPVPLPPFSLPLAATWDELAKRAGAGDSHAACRLGVELSACRMLRANTSPAMLAGAAEREQEIEAVEGPAAANAIAEYTLQTVAAARRCAGISGAQLAMAGRYLRQAALAGQPDARLRYADGQWLDAHAGMFSVLHDPTGQQWQREAVPLMEQALRQGDPAAAFMLMIAYTDDNGLAAGLLPNNPQQAYRYAWLFRRVLATKPPAVPADLAPELRARAEAEAERMYQAYFAGRPAPSGQALRSLSQDWARKPEAATGPPCE